MTAIRVGPRESDISSTTKDIEIETPKISVVLVDDQAMVAEGVRRILATDPAMAFHYVSDPRRALESVLKIGPTVILQDLVMPGVNGLDLLREYRNNPFTREVPVIVLSSKEEPATKQQAFESGANDYMVKLPHRIELLARVRLHSGAYLHQLQRQRAFRDLEASQRKLMEINCELAILNQKLEEATRYKSEFFANVSHELRTPLIAVLGMAEILYDTTLDIHQRELVEVIRTSGETLLPIINDILDLSKVESGKLELEPAPFVLRDAVDQAMDLLAPMAFEKKLEISAWIDQRVAPTVFGDIARVRQVLLNVLNNAIKFTSDGEIYLEAEPAVDADNMIHFCLEDTGAGIPPEKLDFFRSLSQIGASSNRRFGGAGLGLSISHKLTALMGGRMWLESTVEKGTRLHFVISLPAADIGRTGPESQNLRAKRMVALVHNARLIRLLATWAEELAWQLIVRSDQPKNLDNVEMDCLIIDADQCETEIPQISSLTVLLLTRSKNISGLANRHPNAIVLSLPLKKRRFLQGVGALPETSDIIRSPGTASGADPMFSRLNVLVVDDIKVNRVVCVAQLRKLGVRMISEAEDGRQAIAAAQSQAFDLILMDIQMPEIDGLQATRQIRFLLSNAKQPRIVGLTANALSQERERCLEAGMDDKLTKPVRIHGLKEVLEATGK
jgi:two-component system, sensor histidine kinase